MIKVRRLFSNILTKTSIFLGQLKKKKKEVQTNKLIYRGISYESKPPVEITETEVIGKYRGQDVKFHIPKNPLRFKQTNNLKYQNLQYRGVKYSKNPTSIYSETEPELIPANATIVNQKKQKNNPKISSISNQNKPNQQSNATEIESYQQ